MRVLLGDLFQTPDHLPVGTTFVCSEGSIQTWTIFELVALGSKLFNRFAYFITVWMLIMKHV